MKFSLNSLCNYEFKHIILIGCEVLNHRLFQNLWTAGHSSSFWPAFIYSANKEAEIMELRERNLLHHAVDWGQ